MNALPPRGCRPLRRIFQPDADRMRPLPGWAITTTFIIIIIIIIIIFGEFFYKRITDNQAEIARYGDWSTNNTFVIIKSNMYDRLFYFVICLNRMGKT